MTVPRTIFDDTIQSTTTCLLRKINLDSPKLPPAKNRKCSIVAVCKWPEHPPNGGYDCMTAPAALEPARSEKTKTQTEGQLWLLGR